MEHYFYSVITALLTFISPCVLPMLPVYVSYFTAGDSSKRRTFFNALGFTIGLTIVLVTIGAIFAAVGSVLGAKMTMEYRWLVNLIAGLIVIVLGLSFLGVIKLPFLNNSMGIKVKTENMKFFSAIIFGLVYALSFGPCAIAFQSFTLANVVTVSMQNGEIFKGISLQLTYALTLGALFIICAMLIDALKNIFGFIKRHYKLINIISGCILIVLGILMATGVIDKLSALMTAAQYGA